MHFNWDVNIVSLVWLLVILPVAHWIKRMSDNMEKVMNWMREYPPHVHEAGRIRFPYGMHPGRSYSLTDVDIVVDEKDKPNGRL